MCERFRVEVAYRFTKKKGGVLLGMTIEADNEESAIDKAVARHVAPYRARVLLQVTAAKEASN